MIMQFITWVLSFIEALVDTAVWKGIGFVLFLGVMVVSIRNWREASRDQREYEAAALSGNDEVDCVVVIRKVMK